MSAKQVPFITLIIAAIKAILLPASLLFIFLRVNTTEENAACHDTKKTAKGKKLCSYEFH